MQRLRSAALRSVGVVGELGGSPGGTASPCRAEPLLLILAMLLPLKEARAEPSLALCQAWQRSRGVERIQLGNAIGAAAYLTKVRPFLESVEEHPQLLYSPAELKRACGWR